ncbi:hypothetical protein BJ508DRAFT_328193 [Ascobolus immersus RN42]|uniref:Uncharacterized protein n=1 Tax=Ascobolus immersus RN42 TaxID=1160509 RepID=A0A3N4I686_ASCIM|nr:hypothetical protein BJ508DRAFT_328193 [Ascobolus immersus RN42]
MLDDSDLFANMSLHPTIYYDSDSDDSDYNYSGYESDDYYNYKPDPPPKPADYTFACNYLHTFKATAPDLFPELIYQLRLVKNKALGLYKCWDQVEKMLKNCEEPELKALWEVWRSEELKIECFERLVGDFDEEEILEERKEDVNHRGEAWDHSVIDEFARKRAERQRREGYRERYACWRR